MLSPAEDGAERNAYPDLAHTLRGCGAPIISGGPVNRPTWGHHYRIWAQRREYGFGPHRSLLLDGQLITNSTTDAEDASEGECDAEIYSSLSVIH